MEYLGRQLSRTEPVAAGAADAVITPEAESSAAQGHAPAPVPVAAEWVATSASAGSSAVAPAAVHTSWSTVVLILGLVLGLALIGSGILYVLVQTGAVPVTKAMWASGSVITVSSGAALTFFTPAGKAARRKIRKAIAYVIDPDSDSQL